MEILVDGQPTWPFVSHQSPFPLKDGIAGGGGKHVVVIDIPPGGLSTASAIVHWNDDRPRKRTERLAISPPRQAEDSSDVP